MNVLVPNYSCLQKPWLGGYRPQIPVVSSVLNWICWPPKKIPGYATGNKHWHMMSSVRLWYFPNAAQYTTIPDEGIINSRGSTFHVRQPPKRTLDTRVRARVRTWTNAKLINQMSFELHIWRIYRGADKSIAPPGRKKATKKSKSSWWTQQPQVRCSVAQLFI
jgi:hypothetical protein